MKRTDHFTVRPDTTNLMARLTELADDINLVLTPITETAKDAQFPLQVFPIPTMLDPATLAQFPPDFQQRIDSFFCSILLTNALAFGSPKQTSGGLCPAAFAHNGTAIVFLANNLQCFTTALLSFAGQLVTTAFAPAKGEVDDEVFMPDTMAVVQWLRLIQAFSQIIGAFIPSLPPGLALPPFQASRSSPGKEGCFTSLSLPQDRPAITTEFSGARDAIRPTALALESIRNLDACSSRSSLPDPARGLVPIGSRSAQRSRRSDSPDGPTGQRELAILDEFKPAAASTQRLGIPKEEAKLRTAAQTRNFGL
jgi:hypothetical protein